MMNIKAIDQSVNYKTLRDYDACQGCSVRAIGQELIEVTFCIDMKE